MNAASPPATLRVELAPHTRVHDHGRVLVGGVPGRLLKLHPHATDTVTRWRSGAEIGAGPGIGALARRLLDAGLLLPDPAPGSTAELAVIVPTHGRPAQLDRCLEAIRCTAPDAALVVVDDGSPDPNAITRIASAHTATLIRHQLRRGPAAARNTGATATDRPLITFVDSDVAVEPGCLARLAGAFQDPATGAVAPRVLPLTTTGGTVARYEAQHSSLDMGPEACVVRPGSPVPYVPSTTVTVRRDAFGDGFDERLEVGEDVDFIWRLCETGWNVWYDPSVTVRHAHRTSLAKFVKRRFEYAASVGPLAKRHPDALPALWADPTQAVVLLAALGRPRAAALVATGLTIRRTKQMRGHTARPLYLSARLATRSYYGASQNIARAVRRAWWPLLTPMLIRNPRGRTLLLAAWAAGLTSAKPARSSDAALAICDDLLATVGTWWSCMHSRTAIPLLPAVKTSRQHRETATANQVSQVD
jgi:mycofactocin glycosyltransferase